MRIVVLLGTVAVVLGVLCLFFLSASLQAPEDAPLVEADDLSLFNTGDLILFKHNRYKTPWMLGIDRIASHMGVVWRHPTQGPCVIDMNPTRTGPYGHKLPMEPVLEGESILVLKLSDVVQHYPGTVYWRSLRTALSPAQEFKFSERLLTWALALEYEQSIREREVVSWFALAISPFFAWLSHLLVPFSSLTSPRTASFCTEVVAELLDAAGIYSNDHSYLLGPINWQSGIHWSSLWTREFELLKLFD